MTKLLCESAFNCALETSHLSVFTAECQTTCPSCVRQSPESPNDSNFVRPAAAYSSCQ